MEKHFHLGSGDDIPHSPTWFRPIRSHPTIAKTSWIDATNSSKMSHHRRAGAGSADIVFYSLAIYWRRLVFTAIKRKKLIRGKCLATLVGRPVGRNEWCGGHLTPYAILSRRE
jgi:hypothetical protein